MPNTVFIDVPENFSFKSTVYSHGWCELAPFTLDTENWRLSYVFRDENIGAVPAVIFEENKKIRIDLGKTVFDEERVLGNVRHLLRLDDDLDGFYDSIAGHDRLNWIGERRAGRLLRSPPRFSINSLAKVANSFLAVAEEMSVVIFK